MLRYARPVHRLAEAGNDHPPIFARTGNDGHEISLGRRKHFGGALDVCTSKSSTSDRRERIGDSLCMRRIGVKENDLPHFVSSIIATTAQQGHLRVSAQNVS